MMPHNSAGRIRILLIVALLGTALVQAHAAEETDRTQKSHNAIRQGLVFLQEDNLKWRKERECASCHHGTLSLWAYAEAQRLGYPLDPEVVADTAKWTKERLLERIDQPRDTRPGWSMVSTPGIYLELLARAVPEQKLVTPDEQERIARHLLRHQEADGSWSWASAPAVNRPPPFFESDEVATRLAWLALAPRTAADSPDAAEIKASLAKASEWLKLPPPSESTQAACLRLLMTAQAKPAPETLREEIQKLLALQNPDGGWSQIKERASDAYATGQVLYVLSVLGVNAEQPEIQRGVDFLLSTQQPDGSWPMVRRGHPGVTPGQFTVPIVYFGSVWGTLGLLRSTPAPEK